MPFWRTFYHLVWSTHEREPLITESVERELCAALLDKAGELGVYVHAVNTWSDHVHMVVEIPPRLSVAHVVGQLKGRSAHDLNRTTGVGVTWQRGYGVLTLGSRQVSAAVEYVRHQKEHHREATAIAWLEHDSNEDEGPVWTGSAGGGVALREQPEVYGASPCDGFDASVADADG